MNIRRFKWAFIGLLGILLLSGCQANFPTGKFLNSRTSENRYLIFYPDGRWEGFQDGNMVTFGAYTTRRDIVRIETDFQCQDLGFPQPAEYTWNYDEDTLIFQPVGQETCALRADLLSGEYQRSQ